MTRYPVGENMKYNMPIILRMAKLVIDEYKDDPETLGLNIWCRGSSGAIIATVITNEFMRTGKGVKICHIKKQGEASHTNYPAHNSYYKNIMVDDFIASGETVTAIYKEMQAITVDESMDMLIVSSTFNMLDYFDGKLRKIISQ